MQLWIDAAPDRRGHPDARAQRLPSARRTWATPRSRCSGHYGLHRRAVPPRARARRAAGVSGHDGPGFPAQPGWEDGYRETLEYAVEHRPEVHRPRVVAGPVQRGGLVAPAGRAPPSRPARSPSGSSASSSSTTTTTSSSRTGSGGRHAGVRHPARGDRARVREASSSTCTGSSYGGEQPRRRTCRPTRRGSRSTTSRTARGSDRGPECAGLGGRRTGHDRLRSDCFDAGDGRRLDKHFIIEHDGRGSRTPTTPLAPSTPPPRCRDRRTSGR